MLLSNFPNAIWLVDLASGEARGSFHVAARWRDRSSKERRSRPTESGCIYSSKNAAWVISLETPGDPVSISSDPVLPYPGFDAGGNSLIFATKSETGVDEGV